MAKIMKILLCLLAITPLIVDKAVLSPSIAGKSLFLWGIISVISILFVVNFFSNKKWKVQILNRINTFYKNPIVISIFAFITMVLISTIFAVDKYRAFWGDIDRAEGLVEMICFFSVFIFTTLIFEKKDWFNFFKISLFISLIVLFKEFSQFAGGIERPSSFLGNPTFVAGYLLFSIFSASIILSEVKNNFWKYLSVITLILSIIGIFITQTRGTILGLGVGFILVLIYGIIKGKNVSYNKLNLRKLSIIVLASIFIFFAVFIGTRGSSLWQKVPGLSRVAVISSTDSSTQTRLLMVNLGVNAVDPKDNGGKKFLVGWGQDNFGLAYLKYFNPLQFDYENSYFDRSHNKFLDILVMNGVFGLLAYLSIFITFFFYIFKKKEFSRLNAILLLWLISYITHLFFIFDQITTYIPLFIILSYFVYINKKEVVVSSSKRILSYGLGGFFLVMSLFFNFVFWTNTLPGYINMHKLNSLLEKRDTSIMLDKIDSVFYPFTVAQVNIRNGFMKFLQNNYDINSININKLVNISFDKEEEYLKKVPLDLNNKNFLAVSYTNIGKVSQNIEFLKRGEFYFKELLSISPNKIDYNYAFALNLFFQKRYEESFSFFEKSFNLSPILYSQKKADKIESIYVYFFRYFYEKKDKENLIKAAKHLSINNYSDKDNLDKIIEYIEKTNILPPISFE